MLNLSNKEIGRRPRDFKTRAGRVAGWGQAAAIALL
jgi:hypothetical protein